METNKLTQNETKLIKKLILDRYGYLLTIETVRPETLEWYQALIKKLQSPVPKTPRKR